MGQGEPRSPLILGHSGPLGLKNGFGSKLEATLCLNISEQSDVFDNWHYLVQVVKVLIFTNFSLNG